MSKVHNEELVILADIKYILKYKNKFTIAI